jgi:hypothetical protein
MESIYSSVDGSDSNGFLPVAHLKEHDYAVPLRTIEDLV